MKKTIAGIGDIDLSNEEINTILSEQNTWESERINNQSKDLVSIEIRLKALEKKAGITKQDHDAVKAEINVNKNKVLGE